MLGSIFSNAQRRGIDSIYVNPTQANSNDSIIVIAMVRSTSTPCRFDSVAINTIDSVRAPFRFQPRIENGTCA